MAANSVIFLTVCPLMITQNFPFEIFGLWFDTFTTKTAGRSAQSTFVKCWAQLHSLKTTSNFTHFTLKPFVCRHSSHIK